MTGKKEDNIKQFLKEKLNDPWLKAEFHAHTSEDIWDYKILKYSLLDLIKAAKKKDYDVIAITNHDSVPKKKVLEEARKYAQKLGIILIPGVELSIEKCHLLVYFDYDIDHNKIISKIKSYQDIKTLYQKGVIKMVGAPHPFHHFSSMGNKVVRYESLIDFVEYNWFYSNVPKWFPLQRQLFNMNLKTVEFAKRFSKPVLANGDLHMLKYLGKEFTYIRSRKDISSIFGTLRKIKGLKINYKDIQKIIIPKTKPLGFIEFNLILLRLAYRIVLFYVRILIRFKPKAS